MLSVLDKIVEDKRLWVQSKKKDFPLAEFQRDLSQSGRSLLDALSEQRFSFIMEFKKASPSKGLIRDPFCLKEIAQAYKPFAAAVSVLADEKYFQGSYENIRQVSGMLSLPVLCKDFIIDPYQIYLARYYGADAVLLMLSVLNDSEYQQLARTAESLSLDVLTETENEVEVDRALKLKARIIGVNNRNLKNLSVDIYKTKRLESMIPDDVILISESGVATHADVKELSGYSNGCLVGSSLMQDKDLKYAVRKLVFGNIKVCGLTSHHDALVAASLGASFGGLIFVESSKRRVHIDEAKVIINGVDLQFVGVFQDQSIDEISELVKELNLEVVQLHGEENNEYIQQLKLQLPPHVKIWKSFSVADKLPDLKTSKADAYLFDTSSGSQKGGTGNSFDWELLKKQDLSSVIVAGGVGEDNIQNLLRYDPYMIDVNSKVEDAPGKKNQQKLTGFFQKIRTYKGEINV